MRTYLNFMGEDFVADVDYRVTYWGCAAKLYGPPENCWPAEAPEWEVESIVLMWDRPGGLGAEFEATGALFDHLASLDAITDSICEEVSDGPPEPDYWGAE